MISFTFRTRMALGLVLMAMANPALGGFAPSPIFKSLRLVPSAVQYPSESEHNRKKLVETVDFLIKDIEETIKDMKRIGGNKQLLKEYEEELIKLRQLRMRLLSKGK